MQEINAKNVIISKQKEDSENFQEFLTIVNENKIDVCVVEAGQRIAIEKDIYFNILWPTSDLSISENALNNNSIVCKLVYKNFSCIFTGDIEEKAEKAILQKYSENLNILNSTILKVAHHGSKTSTSKEFLEAVSPIYALIGVGANNNFGHPADITIENLEATGVQIYRTDEDGEITIKTNGKKIIIKKL